MLGPTPPRRAHEGLRQALCRPRCLRFDLAQGRVDGALSARGAARRCRLGDLLSRRRQATPDRAGTTASRGGARGQWSARVAGRRKLFERRRPGRNHRPSAARGTGLRAAGSVAMDGRTSAAFAGGARRGRHRGAQDLVVATRLEWPLCAQQADHRRFSRGRIETAGAASPGRSRRSRGNPDRATHDRLYRRPPDAGCKALSRTDRAGGRRHGRARDRRPALSLFPCASASGRGGIAWRCAGLAGRVEVGRHSGAAGHAGRAGLALVAG